MSNAGDSGDLQFERAEFTGGGSGPACANCKQQAAPEYHQFNGRVYCATCRGLIEQSIGKLEESGSMGRAVLFGLGAAAVSSVIYYAVFRFGFQIGIIALLTGYLVGRAVRHGSGSIGGRRYQFLAVFLTYLSIVSATIPTIARGMYQAEDRFNREHAGPEAKAGVPPVRSRVRSGSVTFWMIVVALAFAYPVLRGISGILGIVIIAIGLWEAWRLNRRVELKFTGPFAVAGAA